MSCDWYSMSSINRTYAEHEIVSGMCLIGSVGCGMHGFEGENRMDIRRPPKPVRNSFRPSLVARVCLSSGMREEISSFEMKNNSDLDRGVTAL